jgi:hypothetical protein
MASFGGINVVGDNPIIKQMEGNDHSTNIITNNSYDETYNSIQGDLKNLRDLLKKNTPLSTEIEKHLDTLEVAVSGKSKPNKKNAKNALGSIFEFLEHVVKVDEAVRLQLIPIGERFAQWIESHCI